MLTISTQRGLYQNRGSVNLDCSLSVNVHVNEHGSLDLQTSLELTEAQESQLRDAFNSVYGITTASSHTKQDGEAILEDDRPHAWRTTAGEPVVDPEPSVELSRTSALAAMQQTSGRLAIGRNRQSRHSMRQTPYTLHSPVAADVRDAPIQQMQCFRIDDQVKIKEFMFDRLSQIQQLGAKHVAKAWIKGICPKKQAKFPYREKAKHRERHDPSEQDHCHHQPGWWPDVEKCPFKEPDHILKDERIHLLVHLLRLRPTPDQLRDWNEHLCEPNRTHQDHGWTHFLKDLAPVDSLDDCKPNGPDRVQQRRRLLKDLYELADMEEVYKQGGRSGDDLFHYKDAIVPLSLKRKNRAMSVASTIHDAKEPTLRASSSGRGKGTKKARCESDAKLNTQMSNVAITKEPEELTEAEGRPQSRQQWKVDSDRAHSDNIYERHTNALATGENTSSNPSGHTSRRQRRERRAKHRATVQPPQDNQWQPGPAVPPSMMSSFNSNSGDAQAWNDYQTQLTGQSLFPGCHDYSFQPHHQSAYAQQMSVQANYVGQVPQPQFDTVPNTPIFSPTSMSYVNLPGQQNVQTAHAPTVHDPVDVDAANPAYQYGPQYISQRMYQAPGVDQQPEMYNMPVLQQPQAPAGGLPTTGGLPAAGVPPGYYHYQHPASAWYDAVNTYSQHMQVASAPGTTGPVDNGFPEHEGSFRSYA